MALTPALRGVLVAVNRHTQVYARNFPQQKADFEALAAEGYLVYNPALDAFTITEKGEEALKR